MDQRLKLLRDLLSKYQPILYIWMQRTFPDAAMWLTARLTFARTCAVMSIVGYIMGLGDRHGENLLLDGTNAAVVHCDFSCLFNKGETLDWPERVPFRYGTFSRSYQLLASNLTSWLTTLLAMQMR